MHSHPDSKREFQIDNSTPIYSSRVIMVYIEYLKRHCPDLDIDLILQAAGLTKYAVEDPGHWFNQDQVDRFHDILTKRTGDHNIARKAGRFAVSSERLGPAKQYALGLVNMAFIYLRIGKLANSMTLGTEFTSRRLKTNKAEIICTPKPGVNEKAYQCNNRIGILESVPQLFNESFAVIEHPTCIHSGGDCCRYIVTWPKTPSLKWKSLRNVCLLFSLLALLTSFFILSHSSWIVLVLILAYVQLFIAFKLERIEKKELTKAMETQGNAAKAFLDEMNTRNNNAQLIQAVGQSVSGIVDIDKIAQTVMKIVEKHSNYDCGLIFLENEKKTHLRLAANFGHEDSDTNLSDQAELDLSDLVHDDLMSECFKKHESFLLNEKQIETDFASNLVKFLTRKTIQSFICVPIAYENKSLGILAVGSLNAQKTLAQSDLSLIIGIASHTAISITNAVSFKQIRKSEAKYRLLADNVTDVIWILLTKTMQFSYVSPSVSQMLGYEPAEFMKLPLDAVLTPESLKIATDTIAQELEKEGDASADPLRSRTLELEEYCKDGTNIWIEVTASFLRDNNDNVIGILGVSRDISERKRAEIEKNKLEKRLQQAQKMEAIGTLAGGVAHDLNNILSGIVSYPELLLMDLAPDSPLKGPIETIRESGKKAAAIVQDMLTLARRGVAVADVVNLNDIISEYLISPEFEKLKVYHPLLDIKKDLASDLLNIQGSSVHLFKAVMNLVSNAAEAMPDGGVIAISTRSQYIDRPMKEDGALPEGDYVVLEISDTGIGISEEETSRIFEPFYTKKVMGRSGTGLGMAVVWGTVKDHKGFINLESKQGAGTTFTLYFPATREKLEKDKAKLSLEDYKGTGESILIVDDVKEQGKIASSILTQLGYSVKTVTCGEAAIEYMKNNAADMLVLDMIMDPGIDGCETYRQILKLHPRQKAVIASGFSETDRVKETQKLGAGQYVKKPYTIENIGMAIKSEFDKF